MPHIRLLVVIILLSLTIGHSFTMAQDGTTTVSLSALSLAVGESGVVEAVIDCGTSGCSAFAVRIAYDPAVIRVDRAEVGPYLGAATVVAENVIDQGTGVVRLAATTLGAWTPTLETVLFRLYVTAVAEGLSVLSVTDLQIGDADGSPVAATGLSGVVVVSAQAAPTPTPVPPSPMPTATATAQPTPTSAPTLTPTLDPLAAAVARARNFSGGNADWGPVEWLFDGVRMVLVPAGCFTMGDTVFPDEQPIHRVCFEDPFWIDRYEVTNAQFADFGGEVDRPSWSTAANRPREFISWEEARAFCQSRGGDLPSEAEWEYAARGPDSWTYPWGNEWDAANAAFRNTSGLLTAEVGSRPGGASWVGAMDLIGNVWEFVLDWYDEDYYGTLPDGVVNPRGPASGETIGFRGGSVYERFESGRLRAANRGDIDPGVWFRDLGFRCARATG